MIVKVWTQVNNEVFSSEDLLAVESSNTIASSNTVQDTALYTFR